MLIKAAGLVVVVAAVLSLIQRGRLALRPPSLMLCFTLLLALWALLSTTWTTLRPEIALVRSFTAVQLAVLVWLIWQLCRSTREHLFLLQAYVIGAYALGGKLVFDFLTNPIVPDAQTAYLRYSGIGGDASVNETAAMMALGIPIAWYLALKTRRAPVAWLNLVYLPVALLVIGLTASRSGAIAAIIGLIVVPLTYPYLRRGRKLIVPVLLGALCVMAYITVPQQNIGRIMETSEEITEGNVSNRAQLWEAGLEVFAEHPLLGVGVGNYGAAIEPLLGYGKPAHNAFIAMLVELGIVGLVLFTLAVFSVVPPLFRVRPPDRTCYLVLWSVLFVSLLPNNAENDRWVWILLALLTTRAAYVVTLPQVLRPARGLPARRVYPTPPLRPERPGQVFVTPRPVLPAPAPKPLLPPPSRTARPAPTGHRRTVRYAPYRVLKASRPEFQRGRARRNASRK